MTVDPREFRSIIGHFATGVTVITAAAGGELQGMTANAIASLSLDPVLLLICIDKASHTHRILEEGGAFAVNILGEHQEEVSRLFAQSAPPEQGTLRGQAFRIGKTGAPVLEDSLAYIECRITEKYTGGDHTIFLGEVVAAAVVREVEPLLFFRSQYRTLA